MGEIPCGLNGRPFSASTEPFEEQQTFSALGILCNNNGAATDHSVVRGSISFDQGFHSSDAPGRTCFIHIILSSSLRKKNGKLAYLQRDKKTTVKAARHTQTH
ncbi:hypothetical protein VTO42DRAFT_9056 [Malbranchea cinnamomea]